MKCIQIKLKKDERNFLQRFVKSGTTKARSIARANVLLLADEGWDIATISNTAKVHRQGIWRIRKRFLEEGLDAAIHERPRSGQPKKYFERHTAEIIAQACATPPKGRKRWTVRLLAAKLKKKKGFKTVNRESVRLVLKKTKLNLG